MFESNIHMQEHLHGEIPNMQNKESNGATIQKHRYRIIEMDKFGTSRYDIFCCNYEYLKAISPDI